MIYLDNAATTLVKPPQVIDAVVKAMGTMGNCSRGTHEEALSAARVVYSARERIAKLFNCPRADHVVFTANSTEALNIAISGIIGEGDEAVSTDLEHNSVLRPLYRLETERNVKLSFAAADRQGNIDYAQLASLITPKTRAVVCTHASNLTGNMLDIARIANLAHQNGAIMIVDASQSAGCIPIDMQAMGIDVLCFTGHKGLMGPQGTGGLCIMNGIEIRPFKVGGSGVQSYSRTQPEEYPTRLEAGTLNGHGIAGLSAAVDFLCEITPAAIHAHETALMSAFYNKVSALPGVTVYGDFTQDRAPIVTLNIGDMDSGEAAEILSDDYGIAVRSGAHCAPRMHEALGTVSQGAVRFSFGWFNTMEEAEQAADAVRDIAL